MIAENFDGKSFKDRVINSKGVAIIDFWATWCAPCKLVGPVIDQLADELKGKAIVGKIDVEAEMEIAQSFSVMSVPTVIIFKDGSEVQRIIGVKQKSEYLEAAEANL